MRNCNSSVLLLASLIMPAAHGAKRLITAKDGQIRLIRGASSEPHQMESLAQLGAPREVVNQDLGPIMADEGPCVWVAGPARDNTASVYEADIECFDLVLEKETKKFAYATDSDGKKTVDGNMAVIGEYAKNDLPFDMAGWNWISAHLTPALSQRIAEEHALGKGALPADLQKVDEQGAHGPVVLPPSVLKSKIADNTAAAAKYDITGLSVVTLVVGTDGLPTHIRTIIPLGYGLDDEAVRAVREFRFKPSTLDGNPVPVRVAIEIRFH